MSTLKVEERILVEAPVERVWAFLLDPARVAACLPGAQYDGTEGERTFIGRMKVKVGPVLTEFKGRATMSEVDEAARRVRLSAQGDDKSGGGSARMVMESTVAQAAGGSEIVVVADVDIAGKLVRFGRGMIEGVSKQLFKQFAERVRVELAAPASPGEPPPPPPASSSLTSDQVAQSPAAAAPASEVSQAPPAPADTTSEKPASISTSADSTSEKAEPISTVAATSETLPTPSAPALATRRENPPLDAGALVFSALWSWVKNLFRRLLGRAPLRS